MGKSYCLNQHLFVGRAIKYGSFLQRICEVSNCDSYSTRNLAKVTVVK